jgi:biotin transport system substrate-specific component
MNTKKIVFTGVFTALIAAGAYIRIPLPFLNVTFQMLFALAGGMILGPSAGAGAAFVYMAVGLAGLPVFSGGGGPGYLLQPSFGFILGFIPGAYISGFIYNRKKIRDFSRVAYSYSAGALAAYLIGSAYMYAILKFRLDDAGATLVSTCLSLIPYFLKDVVLGAGLSAMSNFIFRLRLIAAGSI